MRTALSPPLRLDSCSAVCGNLENVPSAPNSMATMLLTPAGQKLGHPPKNRAPHVLLTAGRSKAWATRLSYFTWIVHIAGMSITP
jgi:hypothetical protein